MNRDGKHITYLCPDDAVQNARAAGSFRVCDPELYDAMRAAMRARRPRSIAELTRLPVWHRNMAWFSDAVPTDRHGPSRQAWFRSGLAALTGSDLIVCDPDNGIAWDSPTPSAKHILPEEIAGILLSGASAVIYHHCDRSASHEEQGQRHADEIRRRHPELAHIIPLRFRRGSSRLYLVLAQPAHRDWIATVVAGMRTMPWFTLRHFTVSDSR